MKKKYCNIRLTATFIFAVIIFSAVFLFINRVSAQSTVFNSPSEACRYYINSNIAGVVSVEKNVENDCLLKVINSSSGSGYMHFYYLISSNKYCEAYSGTYFPQPSTICKTRTQPAVTTPQPLKASPKLAPSSSFQIKEIQYDTLPSGKQIKSGDNERIELIMPDGSIIELDANATFTPVSDHEVQSVFGRYRYLWHPFHDGKCIIGQNLVRQDCRKVITRDAIIGDRDTEFLVETDKSGTTVTVLEGLVAVVDLGNKKTVEVTEGQFTYIKHGGLPADPKPYDSAKIDRWWNKKTSEQTNIIFVATISGLMILIAILLAIRRKLLEKKDDGEASTSVKQKQSNIAQLIPLIIILVIMIVIVLSEMGYISLPKINLDLLKN
jgi:hypothetical protein